MSNFRRMLIGGNIPKPAPRLPDEYQEVAWVKTNKETRIVYPLPQKPFPFIDTKFTIDENLTNNQYVFKYDLKGPSDDYESWFHCYTEYYEWWDNPYLIHMAYGARNSDIGIKPATPDVVGQYEITMKDNHLTARTSHGNKDADYTQYSDRLPISGFIIGDRFSDRTGFIGKMYYLKFGLAGQLLLDLVPCVKKETREIGFYNIVDGTFESGYLTAGPMV